MQRKALNILEINASARRTDSITRQLVNDTLAALRARHQRVNVERRDLASGIPLLNADWIEANFTADDERNEAQRETLAYSDSLVDELKRADAIVIGAPIYNFSIPASLKAWIDMVARARKTFRYSENGPVGLLSDKKAYVLVASGGVSVGSPTDFATPYLRHALSFVGIDDVEVIAAKGADQESMNRARAKIADLIHLAARVA